MSFSELEKLNGKNNKSKRAIRVRLAPNPNNKQKWYLLHKGSRLPERTLQSIVDEIKSERMYVTNLSMLRKYGNILEIIK